MIQKRGHGFTIVELLIVIVIIAILVTITIVAFNGVTARSYRSRAVSELSSLARATMVFHAINERYPADVSRNIPSEITPYINGSSDNWPYAPWPQSVFDYDYFIGSDGKEVSQISIRFCPIGGPLSACTFPKEPWAAPFNINSSVYWCITGICRSHPSEVDSYPGYCINCVQP